jgi:hypothetical protein
MFGQFGCERGQQPRHFERAEGVQRLERVEKSPGYQRDSSISAASPPPLGMTVFHYGPN